MSLVFMSFAVAIYSSHTNWEREVNRKPEEVKGAEQPGLKYRLEQAENERKKLKQEIDVLVSKVAESEAARDQVVAKLQTALTEKDGELVELRKGKDEREKIQQEAIAKLDAAEADLKKTVEEVAALREQVRQQQTKVDQEVGRAADIARKLHETQSFLEIANERKEQLEKQVANARLLLKQQGLTIDALPRDRVPTLDGDVLAVADNAIEVSLGGDEGLQAGHTLEVYRAGQYVGRAVVKTVKPDRAVAVIQPEYSRGTVQRGDKVTTRLKS
jgi:DNA repair exonuclease SbcCD ATPase subunit